MRALRIHRATRAAATALSTLCLASAVLAEPAAAPPREAAGTSPAELAAHACELGHWTAAVELLRAVEPGDRSSEAWLCLARARVQLGQWVAALDSYDELAELPADSASRRRGASERRELEARLAWLEVVPSLPLPDAARLTLDGEPISRARVGVAFPVQPGRHWLLLEQRDGTRLQHSWRLEEGEHRHVRLEVAAAAPAPALALSPACPEPPEPAPVRVSARRGEPAESYARWSRWALYGGGIGTGVGFGLAAASGGLDSDGARGALFGVGLGTMLLSGVSIITGVTLGIMSEQRPEQPPQPSLQPTLQPWVSTRGAGVAGRF